MTAMQRSHPRSLAAASLGSGPRHRPRFLLQSCQRSWRAPRAASERPLPPPQRGPHPQPAAATEPAVFDHAAAIEALLEGRQLSQAEAEEATASFIRAFLGESVVAAAVAERRQQRSRQRQQQRRQGAEQSSEGPVRRQGARGNRQGGRGGGQGGGSRRQTPSAAAPAPTVIDRAVEHLCSGQFDEALLAGMPCEKLNWVIKHLGGRGRVDLAEQLFHWMRLKKVANEHSFVKLCEAYEACGGQTTRAVQAWRNARRMQASFKLGDAAAAALLKVFRAKGDLAGGLALLGELERSPGGPPNRYAYNIVLRMCADAGEVGAALRLLGRMRSDGSNSSSGGGSSIGGSDSNSGGSRNDGRGADRTDGGAAGVAREARGMAPGGQQRLSEQQQRQQYQHLQEGGSSSTSSSSSGTGSNVASAGSVQRDERTYGAVLGALRQAGAFNRTPAVHRWLREDGIPVGEVLGAQLLSCYAATGSGGAAEGVFREMEAAGVRPNRTHWNSLIYAHAGARDWSACRAAYARMLEAGGRPDTYTLVALLRCAAHEAAARHDEPAARAGHEAEPSGSGGLGSSSSGAGLASQEDAEVSWVEAQMRTHRVPLTDEVGTALLAYWLGVARGWQPAQPALRRQRQPPPDGAGGQDTAEASSLEGSWLQGRGLNGSGPLEEVQQQQQQQQCEGGSSQNAAGPAVGREGLGGEQAAAEAQAGLSQQQPQQQQPPPGQAEAATALTWQQQRRQHALQQARGVWRRLRRSGNSNGQRSIRPWPQGSRQQAEQADPNPRAPDLRAFNMFMDVQLAAGDYQGVLQTFWELERCEGVMPTNATYCTAIEAAGRAGLAQQEAELRALQDSWRLLHGGG